MSLDAAGDIIDGDKHDKSNRSSQEDDAEQDEWKGKYC
jgi:hypothetical protein